MSSNDDAAEQVISTNTEYLPPDVTTDNSNTYAAATTETDQVPADVATETDQVPADVATETDQVPAGVTTGTDQVPADVATCQQSDMSLYELVQTDLIRCPCCSEIYTYPCILPCLHSFCGACIDKLHQPTTEQGETSNPEVVVTCPTCQTVHTVPQYGYPCNHFLCNLVEIYDAHQEEEIPCTYCQYEFEESPASTRCIDCQDNLCQACTAAHKKTKITRTHVLAPFDQIKLGKYDLDIREVQKVNCNRHAIQPCTQYCQTCQLLFCDECRDHKRHDVIPIKGKMLTEVQQVKELTTTIKDRLPAYIKYHEFLEDYFNRLTTKQDELIRTINARADLLHKMIDTQRDAVLEKIEVSVSEAADDVNKELSVVENMSNSYSSNLQFIEGLLHHSKPEEIIDLQKFISRRLEEVSCDVMRRSLDDELNISFTNAPTDEDCELAIHQLMGDVHIYTRPTTLSPHSSSARHKELTVPTFGNEDEYVCSPRVSVFSSSAFVPRLLAQPVLCTEFNSDLSTDSNNTWPTGVCTTVLGEIVICDRDNAMIKIFTSTGLHKSSFVGELEYTLVKPFDVASLSTGELVVSDYGTESVKVFNTSGIGRLRIYGEFEYPRGVATTKDDHILVLDSELGRVTIHSSIDGKLLKTVKGTSPSTNMIDAYYLSVSRHGDVIVTDFAEPNVKILNINGAQVPELIYGEYGVTTRQGLLQPYGCCQDMYGITFIADNRNDKISVLMPNGKFDQHLLTRKDGLWQPIALCIDMKGQLIITEGLGKVKIFKYV